jgi:betaine-aldehyde dehydrogenase
VIKQFVNLYINGRYVESNSDGVIVSLNPANNQELYSFANARESDINEAVKAARNAFMTWSLTPSRERAKILRNAANLLRKNNAELARLESLDTGKPIQETSVIDVLSGADCLEYYADLIADLSGQHISYPSSFVYTRREPLGVCVGIGAWNFPIQIACWKSAPALACGNTMVFKPSEYASLTALKLAELYTEAGLPDGVFNVITGDGETGRLVVQHSEVAKISFTGSVPTGKAVMKDAAEGLKKVTMELGGKSPLILFEDANLNNAVSAAMLANFYSQGEICSNGTRVFVHSSIYNEFLAQLTERVTHIKIGDPLNPDTQMGPLISKPHLDKVMSYIDAGLTEGASIHYGGNRLTHGIYGAGNYLEPTIFVNCRDDMRIVKEEIFGPVMSILSFEQEEEVIQRANNTNYGLAAGIFTQDIQRAHRVIAKLEAGTCWINNYNINPIEMPFGGNKQSGMGRENGVATLDHYTQLKSIYVELGEVICPYD